MIRGHLIVAFAACFAASAGHAERTWESWLAETPAAPAVTASLEPAGPGPASTLKIQQPFHDAKRRLFWTVPRRPPGGAIGNLAITNNDPAFAGAAATVTLLCAPLEASDLIGGTENPAPKRWDEPLGIVRKNARLSADPATESWQIRLPAPGDTLRVPVAVPPMRWRLALGRGIQEPLASVALEIRGAEDRPLLRSRLIETVAEDSDAMFGMGRAVWILGGKDEPDAERLIRNSVENARIRSIPAWPPAEQPLTEVAAVWISLDAWRNQAATTNQLQRFILAGGWILGKPETAAAIRGSLGFGQTPTAFGLGGVAVPGADMPGGALDQDSSSLRAETWSFADWTRKDGLFRRPEPLFKPLAGFFALWTFGWLAGFLVALACALALLLRAGTTGGRVWIWPGVPLVSIIAGGLAWGLGNVCLPRGTRASITEYRIAVDAWPLVHRRTVLRHLGFSAAPVQFEAPIDAVVVPEGESHAPFGNGGAQAPSLRHLATATIATLPGGQPGALRDAEFGSFTNEPPPVRLVRLDDGSLAVEAAAPVSKLALFRGGKWETFAALRPGERIPQAPTAATRGSPDAFPGRLLLSAERDPARFRARMEEPPDPGGDGADPPAAGGATACGGDWIALAETPGTPAVQFHPPPRSQTNAVYWLVQMNPARAVPIETLNPPGP